MTIDLECPDWPAPESIRAVTTTRRGGVSEGVYRALNLGAHVGDCSEYVTRNRALLADSLQLPSAPVWLEQVHGTELIDLIDDVILQAATPPVADGAITSTPNQVCAIMTADCMPVFICDAVGSEVALLHAGWRGLAAGIVEAAIARMSAAPKDLLVWAGPSIGPTRFVVGADVRHTLGGSDACYLPHSDPNKVLANLYQLLGERLTNAGVDHYSHSTACTYNDDQRFFSYRRDGQCGRMASLLWIES